MKIPDLSHVMAILLSFVLVLMFSLGFVCERFPDGIETSKTFYFVCLIAYFCLQIIVHYQSRLYGEYSVHSLVYDKTKSASVRFFCRILGALVFFGMIFSLYILNKGESWKWTILNMAAILYIIGFITKGIGGGVAEMIHSGTENCGEKYPKYQYWYHGIF